MIFKDCSSYDNFFIYFKSRFVRMNINDDIALKVLDGFLMLSKIFFNSYDSLFRIIMLAHAFNSIYNGET